LVRCWLDPEHDWLPVRVKIGEGDSIEYVVDAFRLVDGRWMPSEGRSTHVYSDWTERTIFKVLHARLNQPVDPARFVLPRKTSGAMVYDVAQGRMYVEGGLEKRDPFLSRIPADVHEKLIHPGGKAPTLADPIPSATPLRSEWPRGPILIGSAAFLLILAFVVSRRSHSIA
jgi:hypothetical protein